MLGDLLSAGRYGQPEIVRPFLIAEAGVNHEGSIDTARRMIDAAAGAGADAIKFQTYRADTLAARESPAYWDLTKEPTTSQRELFSRYDKFWKDEFEILRRHCDEAGIEFLSTPFDDESATFLADLVGAFKVASADLTNHPFLEHVASFGKPVLLSTGASNLWEVEEAAAILRRCGVAFGLMHCVLNYPTRATDANLGMILDLRRHFPGTVIGYSDHTVPDADLTILGGAMLLGAHVIEKHFTLDKTLPGNDHYHAMDVADIRTYVERTAALLAVVGREEKVALAAETPARLHARRSLVSSRPIPRGATISRADLTAKRPAHGISPRDIDALVGRQAREDIAEDTLITWPMIE